MLATQRCCRRRVFENLKEIKSREDLDFFVERLMDPVTKMFKEELAPESQDEAAPVGTNVQGGVGTKMSSQRCKQEEAAYMRRQSLKEKAKALTAAEAADIDMQVSLRIQRLKAEARAAEAAEFAATQGAPVKKVNLKQEPPPSPEASPLHMASPVSPVAKDVTLSPTAARAAAKREKDAKNKDKEKMKKDATGAEKAKKPKEKTGTKKSKKDAKEKRRADQSKKVSSSKKQKVHASESSRSKSLPAPPSPIHRRRPPTPPSPPSLPAAHDLRSPAREFDPESVRLIDWETSKQIQKAPWRKK